jgi:ceroid-lipofuscinosis MFS transporter 7
MKPLSSKHSDAMLMAVGVSVMAISCSLLMSPSTSSAVYLAAIFAMYASGYPLGHTAVLTWFSKLSTQSSQGYLQGWFASAGSFGRIVLPAVAGMVAEYEGFVTLLTALGGFLVLTVLVIGVNYSRFVRLTS